MSSRLGFSTVMDGTFGLAIPSEGLVSCFTCSEAITEVGTVGLPDPNYVELALHRRYFCGAGTHKAVFVEKLMI